VSRLVLFLLLTSKGVAMATPSGNRWAIAACGTGCRMGTQCLNGRCAVQFRQATSIDNSGAMTINGSVPFSSVPPLVLSAFKAWTSASIGCNTNWNSVPAGTFSTPVGKAAVNGTDHANNVIWLTGANWTHLANELALTTTTYFTSTHEIFDADMEFNNNVVWSTSIAPGTYDIESVLVHEAGHFLGLNHTSTSASPVMYPFVPQGTAKRVLTTIDEDDVCAVYPGQAGGQGVPCTAATECLAGKVCEGLQGGTAKVCTQDCTGAGTCPSGFTCQPSTAGSACLPQVGVPDQCRFCQSGGGCSSGLCLRFDTGVTFCSLTCTDSSQCGPTYSCQMPEGFCVPNAMTCVNQCQTAAQCAAGYTCSNGTCTPRGETGDDCSVSNFCKPCSVCTREAETSMVAFCRACCQGQGAGGFCTACANTACMANSSCQTLQTGASSVCLPGATAPGTCSACNSGQCADGLACVAGRCRLPCNPTAPTTCQACFLLNTGDGACACADELATEGEPCGPIGNTLAVCSAGLACVGTTDSVCRTRCDPGVSGSCRTGQVCQLMNGISVCVPGNAGSVCAPCNGTSCASGSCYLGRCYQPCNTNLGNACATCVPTNADGTGICGCPDQISAENEPCGPTPQVHSCTTGTRCIAGLCRAHCDPQVPSCPMETACVDQGGGAFYCSQTAAATGGGSGTTGGGGSARGGGAGMSGGSTGGGTTDLGCGCGPSATWPMACMLWVWAWVRRRPLRAP
jgi:Matrixin